jgi:hypothetical protein
MAINTQKVLLGGLAAGVVLNAIDFVTNTYILGARMQAETEAFKPGLSAMMMTGKSIAWYVISDFIVGILLVWTYAAIRPRFGAGGSTAIYAGLLFWVLGSLFTAGYMHMGMMSTGLWATFGLVWLVNLLLASWVGGWLYKEESTVGA